jgi:hypothetical protein
MTRSTVTVLASLLVAGAIGWFGIAGGIVSTSAATPPDGPAASRGQPALHAEAMIVLTAADTDRGRATPEREARKPARTGASLKAAPKQAKVLPQRHQFADMVELAALMASGFAVGLAAFALGRVWNSIANAGFAGLAIGAGGYAFVVSSQVAQPDTALAAAVLVFSASALAPNLLGRAGLAAARRVGARLFAGRRTRTGDRAPDSSAAPPLRSTD